MDGPAEYIWICRWEEFQHYAPERDRAPAWTKIYNKQLDDDDYFGLSPNLRALLHDTRMVFSRHHGKLLADHRRLTGKVGYRVRRAQLEALSDAGFIEFVSRETLDSRLEKFYASRAHHREVEKEEDFPKKVFTSKADYRPQQGRVNAPIVPTAESIERQIRNGVITDKVHLEAELHAAAINSDTADHLRQLL